MSDLLAFEAYVKKNQDYYFGLENIRKEHDFKVWQAACDYKDKHYLNGSVLKKLNEKYEKELERSKMLIEALEVAATATCWNESEDACSNARRVLARYRGEEEE